MIALICKTKVNTFFWMSCFKSHAKQYEKPVTVYPQGKDGKEEKEIVECVFVYIILIVVHKFGYLYLKNISASLVMTGVGLFQPRWALWNSVCTMTKKATASTVASLKQR